MDDDFDWTTAARLLSGQLDRLDAARFEAWLDADPGRRKVFEELRLVWEASASSHPSGKVDAADRALRQRIARSQRVARISPRHAVRWRWAAAAALIMLAVGVSLVSRQIQRSTTAPSHEYATARGEQLNVTLPDGTQMMLAPASHAQVMQREVELDGEAYFAVVPDPMHAFVVRAGGTVTRDVGTAFDVRAYAGEPHVRIAVVEGAVDIRAQAGAVRAHAGDVASVGSGRLDIRHDIDVGDLMAWRGGRLVFADVPLREVVRELGRWYGVSIVFGDTSVGDRLCTATLDHEPIHEILDALSVSVAARYERRADGTIVMYDRKRR